MITFSNRDELEAYGKSEALVIQEDDIYYSKVLGSYQVAIHESDSGLMPHIADGYWEPWIMLWIIRNVPQDKGLVALDLGANVGFYTFLLQKMGLHVDAYEPNPFVYNLLTKAAAKNGTPGYTLNHDNCYYNQAVSAQIGKLDFVVPRNNYMNGSLHESVYSPDGEDIIQVDSTNRIEWLGYDFIKIDIEGGELEVFGLLDPGLHPLVLIEFRWDRYPDPLAFAQDIFSKYDYVGFVTNDGDELPIERPEDLQQREHEDWMLVLRG